MNAVVTGAAGLIGRALVADLRRRGHAATAVVRREEGAPEAERRVIVDDIAAITSWKDVVAGADVVFHLAAHVHVMDRAAARDLARFRAVNVAATEALARVSADAGVKRFVFLSTIAVHGVESSDRPLREDDPIEPVTAYGTSKAEAEARLAAISAPMEIVTLRAPLVYGPRVGAKFLQLLRIVDRGLPLPFGRIRNARSMMFVGNLTDALIVAGTSPRTRGVYMVADEETWSTPALVRELAARLNRPARLLPVPQSLIAGAAAALRVRERLHPLLSSLVVDTTRFRDVTGWRPPFTAAAGFQSTVDWYRSRRS